MPSNDNANDRVAAVSEFLTFIFRAQLFDDTAVSAQFLREHPELKGLTGIALKTFKDSSSPVSEEDEWASSRGNTFNRSRFSSEYIPDVHERVSSNFSSLISDTDDAASLKSAGIGAPQGWRVFGAGYGSSLGHSRHSSTASTSSQTSYGSL